MVSAAASFVPRPPLRHCRHCGTQVQTRVPAGDNRPRAVCPACATVHYENPLNVVGTLPLWGEQVLLCRRAIEPRQGYWTLPAGFMELGETAAEGALRETAEEAGTPVELLGLYTLLDVVRAGQVHWFFRARMLAPTWSPGEETLEARLFSQADLPWDELAFTTVVMTLRHYFADRASGQGYALKQQRVA